MYHMVLPEKNVTSNYKYNLRNVDYIIIKFLIILYYFLALYLFLILFFFRNETDFLTLSCDSPPVRLHIFTINFLGAFEILE